MPHKIIFDLLRHSAISIKNTDRKLILTVSEKFNNIQKLILLKQQQGVPIETLVFSLRGGKILLAVRVLIFPSLAESFGMGLVEAIDMDAKWLALTCLIFMKCEPSLTFNPLSVDEIADSFRISFFEEMKPSKIKISNKIEELIMLLS